MRGPSIDACWVPLVLLFLAAFAWSLLPSALCAKGDETMNPNKVYDHLKKISRLLIPDVEKSLSYCVRNVDIDWDHAFKFENLDFLSNCAKTTKGDITKRICTATEIKYFFEAFFSDEERQSSYLRPNNNCNLSSWVSGCEPGWGCTLNDDENNQNIDAKILKSLPLRTSECQPCCEGFFCPPGITCMIPCPLGAYCPRATLNKTTGMCDPYSYQVPPGNKNHICGGADIWTDALRSDSIFCSPGSYCPTTTQKTSCSSGHYCRMGSTDEIKCSKFARCPANTPNQKVHIYGFIAIVALTYLLLMIYNCSDQALSTRERRHAKSRERAARNARETIHAREKWSMAKDLARKRSMGLQQQLSRSFSRKKYSNSPGQSPGSSRGKKRDSGNLSRMMQSLDHDPESQTGLNLEIGDKHLKKHVPKSRELHTRSQVFQYAYGQLEKEKAMQEHNKHLTFSGVISRATDGDIRSRPVIEVAFKDLTLTLKQKHKHLLRCVTGKFMPGRVCAVMGPSGAGKTTFLSALMGKTTGCTRSGLILINEKDEPIHAYKKIIGFVPQDDIVHGNLTVEENLLFSARCRLPATMPKADKVLVIERVIDSLGLQAIRDSIVGTVEKRGISGGQKKRVNVGLEMVMEPSLLILDEPTSGLDSSSSMLLLRALRREATEGVNICMVLHQPSYSLFQMFDDLVLLAKGGLIAYQGPTRKAEEYFAGLGINVPDRVNPPDHFIDVLEGMVKLNSEVTVEQLPVRWMLHNGYTIPPDMLHYVDGIGSTAASKPNRPSYSKQQSFAGELWTDMKLNVEMRKDHIENRFSSSTDLSNRVTPGVLMQYRYFLGRLVKQRLRDARLQVADYLILLLAGGCLGILVRVDDEYFGARGYSFTVIAVSLLCMIAALRSFTQDKLHYWRESASGMSSLAYFLSKNTLDHFNTLIKPLVFLSLFYFFNSPRSSFLENYVVMLCLVYCVTGMAYVFAVWLEPGSAQLWSVIVPVVLTLVANQDKDSEVVKRFGKFCYTKWAMEAFVIGNAQRHDGVWLITRCQSLKVYGYDLNDRNLCLVILILYGVCSRVIAYFCLLTFQKK